MLHLHACTLVISLALDFPIGSDAPERAQPDSAIGVESAARALVPLLRSVRQRIQLHWRVQPGTLPPSPFSGRSTTIVAVQIAKTAVDVDPKVVDALDRLLAWHIATSPASAEAILFGQWLDQLKVKAVSTLPPASQALECDTPCVIERFTRPDAQFGRSRKDREEFRDYLLLQALIAAVREMEP